MYIVEIKMKNKYNTFRLKLTRLENEYSFVMIFLIYYAASIIIIIKPYISKHRYW